ncbi:MAG: trigger factor [Candidatus Peregrinibacteria bacterium]
MPKNTSTIKRLKGKRSVCTVTIEDARKKNAELAALKHLGSSLNLKGFRPGKIPENLVASRVNPDQLFEETVRSLLPETFRSLIEEHALNPILPPKVEITSKEPLTLSVTFVEKPDVTVKGSFTIKKNDLPLKEEDVRKMIDFILEKHQTAKEVDRAAKEGDQVTIDFRGFDDQGKQIEGTETTGHVVVIGSSSLIPGFEEALKGMKKRERKSFTINFPKPYHAEALAGKPVTFHVTIDKVEEISKPSLTDAFAREHLGVSTAEEFHNRLKEQMRREQDHAERSRRERLLFEQIRTGTVVDLPEELIEEEQRDLFEDLNRRIAGENMTMEEWLKQMKKSVEDFRKELNEQAKSRLTLRLGIQQLVLDRKIEASEEETEQAAQAFLRSLDPGERSKQETHYQKGHQGWEQMRWQTQVGKLIEQLLASSLLTRPPSVTSPANTREAEAEEGDLESAR